MTRMAWRSGGRMHFLPVLSSDSERTLNNLEWVEARRRFSRVRAAFDDFLPEWFPVFERTPKT